MKSPIPVKELRYSLDLGKACALYCVTDLPMRNTRKGRKALRIASMFLFDNFPWWMPHWWKMRLAKGITKYWPITTGEDSNTTQHEELI